MMLLTALILLGSSTSVAREVCTSPIRSDPADQIAPFARALDKVLTAEEEKSCRESSELTTGSTSSSFDVLAGPIKIRKALTGTLSVSLWKQSGEIRAFEIQGQLEGITYNLFSIDPQFFPELYTFALNEGIEGLETRAQGGVLQDEALAQIYLQNLPEIRKRFAPLVREEARRKGLLLQPDANENERELRSRLKASIETAYQAKLSELQALPKTLESTAHPLAKAIHKNFRELQSRATGVNTTEQKLAFLLDLATEYAATSLALSAASQPILRPKGGVPVSVENRKVKRAFSIVSASQLIASILSDPKKRDSFADLEGLHPIVSAANRENPAFGAHERIKNIAYSTEEIRALSNAIGSGGWFTLQRDTARPIGTLIEAPVLGVTLQLRGSACGNQLCFSGESRLTLRARKSVNDTYYDLDQVPRPGERFSEADQVIQAALRKAGMEVPIARAFRGCIEMNTQASNLLFQGLAKEILSGLENFDKIIQSGSQLQAQGRSVRVQASPGSSASSIQALSRAIREKPRTERKDETFAENFGRALLQGVEEFSEMDLIAALDLELAKRKKAEMTSPIAP